MNVSTGNVDRASDLTHAHREMSHAIAAYPETREFLAATVAGMSIDVEALQRPLRRCDLSRCRGTCCHDGVYLSSEEAEGLRNLSGEARDDLREMGVELPEKTVAYGKWRDRVSGPKTATREEPMSRTAKDYPGHFPDTNCVFLLPDARCSLQVLATERGLHPWHYKPLTCWLHPLSITAGADRKPRLTLYDEATDPQRYPDYDGFVCRTHCGRTEESGEPAWQVLGEEIAALGEIGGRDLVGEIRELIT